MNQTPNIGHLIEGVAYRDAIHVPLGPVEAGEDLRPGDDVRIVDGKAYRAEMGYGIGLVDPWLPKQGITLVKAGQRFWLMIDQGTVTSLRHAWSHPAFRAVPLADQSDKPLPTFERVTTDG